MNDIRERIEKILINDFGLESEELIDTARFERDLGMDALNQIEFMMSVEKEFNISIPDVTAATTDSIGELLDYLEDL